MQKGRLYIYVCVIKFGCDAERAHSAHQIRSSTLTTLCWDLYGVAATPEPHESFTLFPILDFFSLDRVPCEPARVAHTF